MTALGVTLLVIGAMVVAAEAHLPSMGVLGGPGVIAMAVGAVLAVGGLGGGLALGLLAALALVAVGGGVVALSVHRATQVRRRRVRTGAEGMIGRLGVVRSWEGRGGTVLVDGALWKAQGPWEDETDSELHAGDAIVVQRLSGLTLSIRPAEQWELVL